MAEPCQFLTWDSDFFGIRIARVSGNRLTDETLKDVLYWCEHNRIDCLYFLANPQEIQTVKIVEKNCFHMVDIRITQEWHRHKSIIDENSPKNITIRPFSKEDLPLIRKIASKIFVYTRFYSDSAFPRERVEEFYDIWIKNSCEGYADQVLVAQDTHRPVGFISCHNKPLDKKGEIGLIGVSEDSRGQGIGKSLVNAALSWFVEQGVEKVTIVTQGTNIPGLTVCQRVGFCTSAVQLWYHKWFKP